MNNEERPSVTGVYNLSCPCGSNIAVNARGAVRSATCPDCNQVLDFVVSFDPRTRKPRVALVMTPKSFVPPGEKPATRKSRTVKTAAVKAPPAATPPPKPSRPGYAAALCDCGNPVEIRIEEMAGDRTCGKCGAPHRIVVKVDKATGAATATLSPRSPLGARRSAASAPPAAAPTPAGRVSALCACGATLTMDANDLTGELTCGRCRASYHAAAKSDRGGVKSLVLVPKTSPRAKAPPPPPPPPPQDLDQVVFELSASSKVKTVQPPPPPKPERATKRSTTRASLPPGAQKVACPCGHGFIVRRRDLGVETPCPDCGKTLLFKEGRDPQSLAPVITATVVR